MEKDFEKKKISKKCFGPKVSFERTIQSKYLDVPY